MRRDPGASIVTVINLLAISILCVGELLLARAKISLWTAATVLSEFQNYDNPKTFRETEVIILIVFGK